MCQLESDEFTGNVGLYALNAIFVRKVDDRRYD